MYVRHCIHRSSDEIHFQEMPLQSSRITLKSKSEVNEDEWLFSNQKKISFLFPISILFSWPTALSWRNQWKWILSNVFNVIVYYDDVADDDGGTIPWEYWESKATGQPNQYWISYRYSIVDCRPKHKFNWGKKRAHKTSPNSAIDLMEKPFCLLK